MVGAAQTGVRKTHNLGNFGDQSEDVDLTLGFIDSISDADQLDTIPDVTEDIRVRDSYLIEHDTEIENATHGVLTAITAVSSTADESPDKVFYPVVPDDGDVLPGDVAEAIYYAQNEDSVDVLNISLGFDHVNTGEPCNEKFQDCSVTKAAERAAENGVTIVAAAGNRTQCQNIACPAACTSVISVAGLVPVCTAADFGVKESPSPAELPPKAGWFIDDEGDLYPDRGPLCTNTGCGLFNKDCSSCRSLESFEGNIPLSNPNPDTFATARHFAHNIDKDEIFAYTGTSYAAPVVAGALITIMAGLVRENTEYTPQSIRRQVRMTGEYIANGGSAFSAQDVINGISDQSYTSSTSSEMQSQIGQIDHAESPNDWS